MAIYRTIYGTPEEICERLQGAYRFEGIYSPTTLLAVGALTLILATPAVTVTFSGSAGDTFTPKQVAAQIASALTTNGTCVAKTLANGQRPPSVQLVMVPSGTGGLVIDKDGTANTLLRVPTAADTTIPFVAQAKIVGFGPENLTGRYFALIAP